MIRLFIVGLALCSMAQDKADQVKTVKLPDGGEVKLRTIDSEYRLKRPEADTISTFEHARLADLEGKPATINLDRVTVIEYWSTSTVKDSQYWNKMRELENKYKDQGKDIQFISVSYDNVAPGKYHRQNVKNYLETVTPPQRVLVDRDGGLRDLFTLSGPVVYMLFNHHGQYEFQGRGDLGDTLSLFEEQIPSALKRKEAWDAMLEKYEGGGNN